MLTYKVGAKFQKGPESVVAHFDKLDDAKDFINHKLEKDAGMRVSVTYVLYDMGEPMQTFEPGSSTAQAGASTTGSQGKSSTQSFRPNPLQTNLRPSGMPPSSFKETDGDKEK